MNRSTFQIIIISSLMVTACKVMPVQSTRVSQIEPYVQSFDFENQAIDSAGVVALLKALIGPKNYDILSIPYARQLRHSLNDNKIKAWGMMHINLSIVPNDHSKFYVEGHGRYSLVVKEGDDWVIFYTGDMWIKPRHESISKLGNENIMIEFRQHLVNHFAEQGDANKNYVNEEAELVQVFLKIIKLDDKKNIFTLDYDHKHEVKIISRNIGYVEFNKPVNPNDKIIDLRGIKFIKDDY